MLEGIGLILAGALVLVSLVALFLVVSVIFPGIINRSGESLEASSKRSFWLGFVNTLAAAILIGVFVWLGENVAEFLSILVILILVFYLPSALFGLIALGRMIGEKLFGQHSRMKQQAYGSAVMILACLVPFLGWYVLFPFLLIQGFGAFLVAVFPGKKVIEQENL